MVPEGEGHTGQHPEDEEVMPVKHRGKDHQPVAPRSSRVLSFAGAILERYS